MITSKSSSPSIAKEASESESGAMNAQKISCVL